MRVAVALTTIASPRPARECSEGSRQECGHQPHQEEDSGYGISSGSTNEIPAAKSQYAAGPANGNHRRGKGKHQDRERGKAEPQRRCRSPDEPRPRTTSRMATIASSAISRSNQ